MSERDEFYQALERHVAPMIGDELGGADFILNYVREDGRMATVSTMPPRKVYERLKHLVDNWDPVEVDNWGG